MKIEKAIIRLLYKPAHLIANSLRWIGTQVSGRGHLIRILRDEEEMESCKVAAYLNVNRYNELARKFNSKPIKIYELSGFTD
jgi:hypothetical protein